MGANSCKYIEMDRQSNINEVLWHPLSVMYKAHGYTKQNAINNLRHICRKKKLDIFRIVPYTENDYYCGVFYKNNVKIYNKVFVGYNQSKNQFVAILFWNYAKIRRTDYL